MSQSLNTSAGRELRVIIVGGGIGGLCLAQGLKKSGISVTLFERDESAAVRSQGYGFHVNPHGSQALHECLPEHLFELYVATSSQPSEGTFALYDSQLRQLFAKPLPKSEGDLSQISTGVNRQTLREILLAGLDDIVRFGKHYHHFTQLDNGQIAVHFADGTTTTADLLVGADGTNSTVRAQLVPDAGFDDLGRAIYGKTPLTGASLEWLPQVFVDGMPRIADDHGISMGVAAYRKRERFVDATARLAADLQLTEAPDYLRWTLSSLTTEFPVTGRMFWEAHGAALQQVVIELVSGWHPTLRRIIDEARRRRGAKRSGHTLPGRGRAGRHRRAPVRLSQSPKERPDGRFSAHVAHTCDRYDKRMVTANRTQRTRDCRRARRGRLHNLWHGIRPPGLLMAAYLSKITLPRKSLRRRIQRVRP